MKSTLPLASFSRASFKSLFEIFGSSIICIVWTFHGLSFTTKGLLCLLTGNADASAKWTSCEPFVYDRHFYFTYQYWRIRYEVAWRINLLKILMMFTFWINILVVTYNNNNNNNNNSNNMWYLYSVLFS